MKDLYVKFASYRAKEFQISTKIYRKDGELVVEKSALHPYAKSHIQHIAKISELYGIPVIHKDESKLVLKYISGTPLSELILDAENLNDEAGVMKILKLYYGFVTRQNWIREAVFNPSDEFVKIFGAPLAPIEDCICVIPGNIDQTFENILIDDKGNLSLIDIEWVFDFPIPIKYIFYRCFVYHCSKQKGSNKPENNLFKIFGISEAEWYIFNGFDKNFFTSILGPGQLNHNIRFKKDIITPDLSNRQKKQAKVSNPCLVKIFFPLRGQYYDKCSYSFSMETDTEFAEFSMPIPKKASGKLRISFTEAQLFVEIKDISIIKRREQSSGGEQSKEEAIIVREYEAEKGYDGITTYNNLIKIPNPETIVFLTNTTESGFYLDYEFSEKNYDSQGIEFEYFIKMQIRTCRELNSSQLLSLHKCLSI